MLTCNHVEKSELPLRMLDAFTLHGPITCAITLQCHTVLIMKHAHQLLYRKASVRCKKKVDAHLLIPASHHENVLRFNRKPVIDTQSTSNKHQCSRMQRVMHMATRT
jgi:hypothetical protein